MLVVARIRQGLWARLYGMDAIHTYESLAAERFGVLRAASHAGFVSAPVTTSEAVGTFAFSEVADQKSSALLVEVSSTVDGPEAILLAIGAFVVYAIFAAALVRASVVDVRTRLVPQASLVVGIIVWAVAAVFGVVLGRCPFVFAYGHAGLTWVGEGFIGGLIAGGFSLLCGALLEARSGRMALGGGDVKLLFVVGLYLGPGGGLVAMGLSSLLALTGQALVAAVVVLTTPHSRRQAQDVLPCNRAAAKALACLKVSHASGLFNTSDGPGGPDCACGDETADTSGAAARTVSLNNVSPSSEFLATTFPFVPFITGATLITVILLVAG